MKESETPLGKVEYGYSEQEVESVLKKITYEKNTLNPSRVGNLKIGEQGMLQQTFNPNKHKVLISTRNEDYVNGYFNDEENKSPLNIVVKPNTDLSNFPSSEFLKKIAISNVSLDLENASQKTFETTKENNKYPLKDFITQLPLKDKKLSIFFNMYYPNDSKEVRFTHVIPEKIDGLKKLTLYIDGAGIDDEGNYKFSYLDYEKTVKELLSSIKDLGEMQNINLFLAKNSKVIGNTWKKIFNKAFGENSSKATINITTDTGINNPDRGNFAKRIYE